MAKMNGCSFDYDNKITRVDYPDATYSAHKYDALGRRIEKRDRSGNINRYYYDGQNFVAERHSRHSRHDLPHYSSFIIHHCLPVLFHLSSSPFTLRPSSLATRHNTSQRVALYFMSAFNTL